MVAVTYALVGIRDGARRGGAHRDHASRSGHGGHRDRIS